VAQVAPDQGEAMIDDQFVRDVLLIWIAIAVLFILVRQR
jgi:hypothetical protein